jgi:hypothetical protein
MFDAREDYAQQAASGPPDPTMVLIATRPTTTYKSTTILFQTAKDKDQLRELHDKEREAS